SPRRARGGTPSGIVMQGEDKAGRELPGCLLQRLPWDHAQPVLQSGTAYARIQQALGVIRAATSIVGAHQLIGLGGRTAAMVMVDNHIGPVGTSPSERRGPRCDIDVLGGEGCPRTEGLVEASNSLQNAAAKRHVGPLNGAGRDDVAALQVDRLGILEQCHAVVLLVEQENPSP